MAIRSVLITGGSGFVGTAIVRSVAQRHPECSITILDLQTPKDNTPGSDKISFIKADVTSAEIVSGAIEAARPDVVVHTAALVPPLSERYHRRLEKQVFKVNIEGTRNVLDASIKASCPAFVYTSSCTAVTDDLSASYANIDERWPVVGRSSIYGESKAHAEAIVLAAAGQSIQTCVLRPSALIGPGDPQLLPSIHACIAKKETPYQVGDGTNLWDVTYVDNVADAHVLAAQNLLSSKTASGEVLFIQNNEPISFRELSLEIWKRFGHFPPYCVPIPQNLAWFMGLMAEVYTWLWGTPTTLSRGSVQDACIMRYANGEKATRLLHFEPRIGIEEGIKLSCEDYARFLEKQHKRVIN